MKTCRSIPNWIVVAFSTTSFSTAAALGIKSNNKIKMSSAPTMKRRRLIWHRRDLRLDDNELYRNLNNDTYEVMCLYVIDPTEFAPRKTLEGLWTVMRGPHATRCLVEALQDLRNELRRQYGGDLIIRRGDPTEIVPALARQIHADEVCWSEEPSTNKQTVSQSVRQQLLFDDDHNVSPCRVVVECSCTLYHPNDLPYGDAQWSRLAHPKQKPSKRKQQQNRRHNAKFTPDEDDYADTSRERLVGMPRIMGDFRRACRSYATVRSPYPKPSVLSFVSGNDMPLENNSDHSNNGNNTWRMDPGEIPTVEELVQPIRGISLLGLPVQVCDELIEQALRQATLPSRYGSGGATRALDRLHTFISSGKAAKADRSLADVTSEHNQSSHLSAYLAVGALSPRQIYRAAAENGRCEWLQSHMEMRDFFLYNCFYLKNDAFSRHGPRFTTKTSAAASSWKSIQTHQDVFTKWATGQTGLPLVDAAMRQLMQTGYCSNRVRQNAASVLAKDLRLDWRAGAEWFQICLADHCVAANYGNWAYFAGTGSDPKNRHFRTVSQAMRYDPTGQYVCQWLPTTSLSLAKELHGVQACFRPWEYNVENWPTPIVDVRTQLTWADQQNLRDDKAPRYTNEDASNKNDSAKS